MVHVCRGLASVAVEDHNQEEQGSLSKELRYLTPSELEFFKRIVDAIVKEPRRKGMVDYNVALNMRDLK